MVEEKPIFVNSGAPGDAPGQSAWGDTYFRASRKHQFLTLDFEKEPAVEEKPIFVQVVKICFSPT